jgi:hypothetical protein
MKIKFTIEYSESKYLGDWEVLPNNINPVAVDLGIWADIIDSNNWIYFVDTNLLKTGNTFLIRIINDSIILRRDKIVNGII